MILDNDVLIWMITDSGHVGKKARKLCDEALASGRLSVSAISWWEIEMLSGKVRIELNQDALS